MDDLSPADLAEDKEEKRLLWQAEVAAKNAAVAEQVAEAASDDDSSVRSSMVRAGRSAERAAHAAAREENAISHRAQTQLQQDSQQARLLGEASLDADMVDWERQRARAEREQARGYAGGGEERGSLADEKSRQAREATQLELSDLGRAQQALGGLQDGGEGGGGGGGARGQGVQKKRHVAEKPLMNPFAIMQDPRDAQRCMQECLKDCADECELERKSAPGAACSLDCGQECGAMCPGGAPFLHGSAHNAPAMDHSRSSSQPLPRVARDDGMIPDSFSGDADQEVSDGRPGPELHPEQPKQWAQDVDEDPEEPADGSGKEVQPETPMVGRAMDKTCIDECLPKCEAECPQRGGDQAECSQDCALRCDDDCYIDEAGGPPSPPAPSRPPPRQPPASTGDPLMDAILGEGGPSKPAAPKGQEEETEMEAAASKLMQGCVGGCLGQCVPQCLQPKGLARLPLRLDDHHIHQMQASMPKQAVDSAVAAHAQCSDACLDRCFPACEQKVAPQIQAQFGSGGEDQEEGAATIAGGRGGARSRQNRFSPYAQEVDVEGNPVMLPAPSLPSPFASALWSVVGVGVLAAVACLIRSGRICRKRGRPGVGTGMTNF